jgi:hypothetical protein
LILAAVGWLAALAVAKRKSTRNDLGEKSLASPAIAGDAISIRTESKLYKIGGN